MGLAVKGRLWVLFDLMRGIPSICPPMLFLPEAVADRVGPQQLSEITIKNYKMRGPGSLRTPFSGKKRGF
jgi:hypothetical protein